MTRTTLTAAATITLSLATLAGCAGSNHHAYSGENTPASHKQAPSDEGYVDSDGAPAAPPQPGAYGGGGESRASADAMDSEGEAPPSGRPGLGTQWGEARSSRTRSASFFRANRTSPFSVAKLFYNDAQGVRAMSQNGFINYRPGSAAVGSALSVSLHDSTGAALRGARTGGRVYVIGEAGERYSIRIKNHTGHRFEAVATVDGLDVIDGEDGSVTKRGYVVGPWATVDIDGFRTSEDTVAAFRFGSVRGSYAAKKGKGRNVGVIGIAFFNERGTVWSGAEIRKRHTADPFPGKKFAEPPPAW